MASEPVCLLVVEDDHDLRETIAMALDSAGYRVVQAPDGESALELVEEHDIRAAVLDMALPGMNGYDLARKLRQRGDGIALVAVTGKDRMLAIVGTCFDAVIRKPFEMGALIDTCKRLCAPPAAK